MKTPIQTNVLFDREQLIAHSQGKVSSIFGSRYQELDDLAKRIRLPAPLFLMVDRVIEMTGDFMSLEGGRIITETDLNEKSWFPHEERLSLGFLLEGAQGHLLLLSWLGWDFRNKESKLYRMLGGKFKLLGEYPKYGETIKYDIRIYKLNDDNQNVIELDYDCYADDQLILTVCSGKVEAFIQTMAFYLTGLGYSLDKDGWRFEVVPDLEYSFVPRGQVLPTTQGLIYEVFIEELLADPFPTLFASVLATTSEGIKVYQMSYFGLRLIPDGPLSRHKELLSPPFQFMSRVEALQGEKGAFKADGMVSISYGKRIYEADFGVRLLDKS